MATKTKKKSNYRTFGSVKILESGKYQASYKRTIGGKPKTFYAPSAFATKTEANNWLMMEGNLVLKNTWTEPGTPNPVNTETPTFGVFAARHIKLQTNSKGENLKPSTAEKYESYLVNNLNSFAATTLDEVTKAQVDEWWVKAVAGGKLTTASKAYKFMHSVFVRAAADGWLKSGVNPCQVKGAQNATSGKQTYTPTMSEVAQVAQNIKPEYRVLVLLSAYAALRFGEVTALRRKHLQLKQVAGVPRYEVRIEEAVTYVGHSFILGTPKNAKGLGSVLITSALTETFTSYLEAMDDENPESLLFKSSTGNYIRNYALAKAMKAAAKKAGLGGKAITPHSLRRAGGTEYGNCGANITEVKDFIRDSSTNAAIRYVQSTSRTVGLAENMSVPFACDTPPLE
jgi:integrase